ncbi:kinase-like domain-containing protein, partial [Roridomyces roridus]
PTEQRKLHKALRRLSAKSQLYPQCFSLPPLNHVDQVTGGTYGDVFKAYLGDQTFAVKQMRVWGKVWKAFAKEAITWGQLSHPNILPFYGLYKAGTSSRLCLVSPWMENGHIGNFMKTQQVAACDIDKLLSLILDIALGLEYLHKREIIHGDLKNNILVTAASKACIADLGLCALGTTLSSFPEYRTQPCGCAALRYKAPELHDGERTDSRSDIYSFACLMYELMAGELPFSNVTNDGALIRAVTDGKRPECPPPGCRSEIRTLDAAWRLVEDCWAQIPEKRPTAAQIVVLLKGAEIGAKETTSAGSWD